MAMTCCEAGYDIFRLYLQGKRSQKLREPPVGKGPCQNEYEEWQDYGGVGPVLYAESVEPAEPIKDIVQF